MRSKSGQDLARYFGRSVAASLLLGLYGADGLLNHVGFSSAIKAKDKLALTEKLETIVASESFTGNAPGGPSRWSTKRSSEWQAVKPKFVVEVSYDHFSGGRFRHGTTILRWRPDKKPSQCTMDQVKQKVAARTPECHFAGLARPVLGLFHQVGFPTKDRPSIQRG
jgi:ATP-dependent DNA ligase